MRKSNFLLTALSAYLSLAMAACGGGSQAITSTSIEIKTQLLNPVSSWTLAAVSGNDLDAAPACSVETDSNCIVAVGDNYGGATGSIPTRITGSSGVNTGVTSFQTDALPGDWYFAAIDSTEDTQNQCPQGGSWSGQIGPPTPTVAIYCDINPVGMASSPASCTTTTTITTSGSTTTSNCPATVTLTTVSGSKALPKASLIQAGNFNDSGDLIVQDTPSAVSGTSVSLPVPTTAGTTYLILRNSSNNEVIGIGEFTFNSITINELNPCAPRPSCGPIQSPTGN